MFGYQEEMSAALALARSAEVIQIVPLQPAAHPRAQAAQFVKSQRFESAIESQLKIRQFVFFNFAGFVCISGAGLFCFAEKRASRSRVRSIGRPKLWRNS